MYFNTGVLNFNIILKIFLYVHSDYASRLGLLVWGTHKTITILLSFIFFIFFDDAMNDK